MTTLELSAERLVPEGFLDDREDGRHKVRDDFGGAQIWVTVDRGAITEITAEREGSPIEMVSYRIKEPGDGNGGSAKIRCFKCVIVVPDDPQASQTLVPHVCAEVPCDQL